MNAKPRKKGEPMLTPREAAERLGVKPDTLTENQNLHPIRTPGGHRRYPEDEVEAQAAKKKKK